MIFIRIFIFGAVIVLISANAFSQYSTEKDSLSLTQEKPKVFFDSTSIKIKMIDTLKRKDIVHFLVISGHFEDGTRLRDHVVNQFRNNISLGTEEYWDKLINSYDPNYYLDRLTLLFDKYFTHEDILQLIAFYQSAAGKKYNQVMPFLAEDIYAIQEDWGYEIHQSCLKKLEADGYVKVEEPAPSGNTEGTQDTQEKK